MLRSIGMIKNLKLFSIGFIVVVLVGFAAYNYTVYLNNKIDALVTDRDTLSQIITRYETSTKQLEKTITDNNILMMGEIEYLNKSFTKYESMLSANRKSVDELSKLMSGVENEQIQTCFNTDLPDSLVDSLFNRTKADQK